MVLQVEAIVIRWLNVLDMVQLAPQIDVKSTMFYRLPALAEVRAGSVNTQADDASLLNQPAAFHEESSLGLCSNIISGMFFNACNCVKKWFACLKECGFTNKNSDEQKKVSHLAASSATPGK